MPPVRISALGDILSGLLRRGLSSTLVLAATLTVARAAVAQSAEDSVYRVGWWPDLAVAGGAAAIWIIPQVFIDDLVTPSCPCNRSRVPAFDRVALDRSSRAALDGSNVAVTAMLLAPALLDTVDVRLRGGRWSTVGEDVVVMGEALLVNGAIGQLVKLAVHRPRPLAYGAPDDGTVLAEPDTYLSFYSSHSSNSFAVGMAYASTFALHHPRSPYRYVVYGAAAVAAASVGTLRVLAGKHFPSDVLTGALVGSAIGLTIPRLHRRSEVTAMVSPGGVMVAGRF